MPTSLCDLCAGRLAEVRLTSIAVTAGDVSEALPAAIAELARELG